MHPAEPVSLTDLGVTRDPGTDWHPRPDKANAYDECGDLPDLNDREVVEHGEKPEAFEQIDGVACGPPLAAEDSQLTQPDAI